MQITGLEIYGYGKLENIKLATFSKGLQGVFGQNEAGKSTLMSFIHSILFGFPTKQQSMQRYEPKSGQKYGGKVYLATTTYGLISVERIKSTIKATGDVTVTLPDGTTSGEEILTQLFKGMDKASYQRIYSFDIHGIQKVHTIKSEDLGKYLFSSGMIGTEVISNVDSLLNKELETLFKPNGKKPLLNEKLRQLKMTHQQLIKSQETNHTYNHLHEKKRVLEDEGIKNDQEKEDLNSKWQLAKTKKTIFPLLKEKTIILHKLSYLPAYEPFPVDGVKRFEQIRAGRIPYETRKYGLEKKKDDIVQKLQSNQYNEEMLTIEPTVKKLLASKSLIEAKKEDSSGLRMEIAMLNQEIKNHKDALNMIENDEQFLLFNTSFTRKQAFLQLTKEYEQLEQQKRLLDVEFSKIKAELEASEVKISEFEKECLDKDSRFKIENIVRGEHTAKYKSEADFLTNMLINCEQQLEKTKSLEMNRKKTTSVVTLFGWIFCLGLFLYSIFTKSYPIMGISVIVAVIFLFFRSHSSYKEMIKDIEEEHSGILSKQKKLSEKIRHVNIDSGSIAEAGKKLAIDDQINSMLVSERIVLKQKEVIYDKIINSFETWEKNWFEANTKVENLKKDYHLPAEATGSQLVDLFLMIEQTKELVHKKNLLTVKLGKLSEEINTYIYTINSVAHPLETNEIDEFDRLILLKKHVEEEKVKYSNSLHLQNKIVEIDEELLQIANECDHLNGECQKLFDQAEVNTEDDFLAKGESFLERIEFMHQLELINGQLSFYTNIDTNEKVENEEELNEIIENYSIQINTLKEKEKEIQAMLSEVKFSMKQLEDGKEYSNISQTFSIEKSAFQDQFRKWAVLAVAKDMLIKTVNVFKNERLPAIMKEVEKYMLLLTNGEYIHVYAPVETQTFMVERSDGTRFSPDELSQATAEQLYISLRFALATKTPDHESYPIIIDDSFVNFDSRRTESAFRLLRELSQEHQIFFFSCHPQIQTYFENDEVIKL